MSKFVKTKGPTTVKVFETLLPKIAIKQEALIKMQLFVENCTEEVGWLGTAHKEKGYVIIDEVFLFDQEVHATTTEITPEGLTTFAEELLQQENGIEIWNNMRVWGHSHVNMSVSPSGQDDNQMITFADNGQDWFIRIIANKKGDIKIDLYEYALGIAYLDLPWSEVVSREELAIKKQIKELQKQLEEQNNSKIAAFDPSIKEEIERKVKKKTFFPQYQWANNTQPTGGETGTYTKVTGKVTTLTPKENLIKSIEDVFKYFEEDELKEIADCLYEYQARQFIVAIYKNDIFTKDDIKFIYKSAKELNNKTKLKQN